MAAIKSRKKSKIKHLNADKIKKKKNLRKKTILNHHRKKKFNIHKKVSEIEGITIINTIKSEATKVKRILPHWLRHPQNIKSDVLKDRRKLSHFSSIIDSLIISTLKQNEIKYLFPVQCSVIKSILSNAHGLEFRYRPRDMCVAAPTGSGKTLSYVLPIVQVLSKRNVIDIRAIVILPVTELARQVAREFKIYAEPYGLIVGSIYGEASMHTEQNIMLHQADSRYQSKIDILVCTPGRLSLHLSQTTGLDLSKLRFLVLDEADHLLTGDWGDTISDILKFISSHQKYPINLLPPTILSPLFNNVKKCSNSLSNIIDSQYFIHPQSPAQKLLFSATLSHNPQQLRVAELHNPLLFATSTSDDKDEPVITEGRTGQFVRPPNLIEEYIMAEPDAKALCLFRLLLKEQQSKEFRVLVFANTVEVVHRLSILLNFMNQNQFKIHGFSSAIDKRRKILRDFRAGNINILISTDAMARGIDVDNINCVISYEVVGASTYTHRSGRTARAGRAGKSISIVTKNEMTFFRKTLGEAFQKVTEIRLAEDSDNYAEKYRISLIHLGVKLKKEVKMNNGAKFINLKQNNKNLRKFVTT